MTFSLSSLVMSTCARLLNLVAVLHFLLTMETFMVSIAEIKCVICIRLLPISVCILVQNITYNITWRNSVNPNHFGNCTTLKLYYILLHISKFPILRAYIEWKPWQGKADTILCKSTVWVHLLDKTIIYEILTLQTRVLEWNTLSLSCKIVIFKVCAKLYKVSFQRVQMQTLCNINLRVPLKNSDRLLWKLWTCSSYIGYLNTFWDDHQPNLIFFIHLRATIQNS